MFSFSSLPHFLILYLSVLFIFSNFVLALPPLPNLSSLLPFLSNLPISPIVTASYSQRPPLYTQRPQPQVQPNPPIVTAVPQQPYRVPTTATGGGPIYTFPVRQQLKSRLYTPPDNPNLVVDYLGYWFINCSIGGQIVNPILDTGSADIWFLGPTLPQIQTQGLKIYNPHSDSTSLPAPSSTFNISYGDGNNLVSGPVYYDALTLFPSSGSSPTLTIPHTPIGVASIFTNFFHGELGSGIVGLAFPSGNSIRPNPSPSLLELWSAQQNQGGQGQGGELVMTTLFRMDGTGEFGIGGVDESLVGSGGLVGVQVIGDGGSGAFRGSWSVLNVTYISGGREIGEFAIVFDTGGPQTTGPNTTVYAYYSQIPGAVDITNDGKAWNVPCSTVMPDLTMRFAEQGGVELIIPGASFLQANNGDGTCQSWFGVEDSPVRGLPGNAFFMSHYVVFDQGKATVSWARQI